MSKMSTIFTEFAGVVTKFHTISVTILARASESKVYADLLQTCYFEHLVDIPDLSCFQHFTTRNNCGGPRYSG